MSRISILANLTGSAGVSLVRRLPPWIFKTSLLSLLLALFVGTAAAQPGSWPITNSRQPQPTQEQLESARSRNAVEWNREWNRWNARVAPEVDHLNDEIMRAAGGSER